jgi:hypothetical protein
MRVATTNDIIDFSLRYRVAIDIVAVLCAVLGICAIVRLWRVVYILIGFAAFAGALFACLQFTSIDIHPFDQSWDVADDIALDGNVTKMAKRAQFDAYICGIPSLGRVALHLEAAARHGSDYDLFFVPLHWSDTLVVYRFSADGKPLWKTCTGLGAN